MKIPPPFRILVVSASNSLANQLIAALRKDHFPVCATGVNHQIAFMEHLQQHHTDLVLLVESDEIIPQYWLEAHAKSASKTPVLIACTQHCSPEHSLHARFPACEFIPASNPDALSSAIKSRAMYAREKNSNRMMTFRIQEMERQHRLLLDNSQDAIAILGKSCHLYCNDRYAALLAPRNNDTPDGLNRKQLLNCSLGDLLVEADRKPLSRILNSEISGSKTLQVCSKASRENLFLTFSPFFLNNEQCLQLTVKPASGNSSYSKDKQSLANQDLLTRLENQQRFIQKVELAIAAAINNRQFSTLMLVQIDAFQEMQVTIGKSGTNKLLYEISEFLNNAISKPFLASRMADNEFGLLLYDSSAEQGVTLANYIYRRLNSAFSGGDKPMAISASLGLSFINELALDARDMINRARINRNLALTRSPVEHAWHSHNAVIPELIRTILDTDEWRLGFQPLLSFTPNSLEGYIVLADIEGQIQGQAGELQPGELFAHANIHNLAGEIDRGILKRLITRQHGSEDGSDVGNDYLYIPISGNTLVNKSMLTWLSSSLQHYRGSAEKLIFLISEIDLCGNTDIARSFCKSLEQLGIRIAITHFGSAMEPLSLSSAIKPVFVLLDDTLCGEILYSQKQQQSVRKLIRALHYQKVSVAVSGIEEIEVLPLLWELGVDLIQGACLGQARAALDYCFPREEKITLRL